MPESYSGFYLADQQKFLNSLVGSVVTDFSVGHNDVIMTLEDGRVVTFYHEQDCCESVTVEDVIGDVNDLIGRPLTMCEVETNLEAPQDILHKRESNYYVDSETWTFYKFATVMGYVTIRWCGESNGYYSESVDVHVDTKNKILN